MNQRCFRSRRDPVAHTGAPKAPPAQRRRSHPSVGSIVPIVAVASIVTGCGSGGDEDGWQTADVAEQGAAGTVYEPDGARLERGPEGLHVEVVVPTPGPGTYEYPTRDMIPPWVEDHPSVGRGSLDAPEVFTLWLFAFNDPAGCTAGECDSDDLGIDVAARGGVHQVDGRVADDETLRFSGNVRLGQQPKSGSPLDDPLGAEVHIAIAPHGRALSGTDRVTQLNTPVGNPSLWWPAQFPSD